MNLTVCLLVVSSLASPRFGATIKPPHFNDYPRWRIEEQPSGDMSWEEEVLEEDLPGDLPESDSDAPGYTLWVDEDRDGMVPLPPPKSSFDVEVEIDNSQRTPWDTAVYPVALGIFTVCMIVFFFFGKRLSLNARVQIVIFGILQLLLGFILALIQIGMT